MTSIDHSNGRGRDECSQRARKSPQNVVHGAPQQVRVVHGGSGAHGRQQGWDMQRHERSKSTLLKLNRYILLSK
jgi:hypothetical protein